MLELADMSVGVLLSRLAWVLALGLLFMLAYSKLFSPDLQRTLDRQVRLVALVLVGVGAAALITHFWF